MSAYEKRILSILFAAVMLVGMLPIGAVAEGDPALTVADIIDKVGGTYSGMGTIAGEVGEVTVAFGEDLVTTEFVTSTYAYKQVYGMNSFSASAKHSISK